MFSASVENHVKVSLREMTVRLKVGIHGWEKKQGVQRVTVNVALYRRQGKFTGKTIRDCIDYDGLFDLVTKKWPQRKHTELLEMLLEELVQYCFETLDVDAVRASVTKPDVFRGKAVPAVEFFRRRPKKKKLK